MENWKEIPGYEGYYAVSSEGRVMRLRDGGPTKAGYILKPQKDACGYLRVHFSRRSICTTQKVHRLVLAAFVGPRDSSWEANHKNFNRADNRLENLEYMRHVENTRYSSKNYVKRGEANPKAKITAAIALDIRSRKASGQTPKQICAALSLSKHIVDDVSRRRSWVHI